MAFNRRFFGKVVKPAQVFAQPSGVIVETKSGIWDMTDIYLGVKNDTLTNKLGFSSSAPALSALQIKQQTPTATSGLYWILKNNIPTQIYCDMETDGGGWMVMDDSFKTWSNNNYSYNSSTKLFSLYANTTYTTSEHFGVGYTLTVPFTFSEINVVHSGGVGYSCAGVTWNNYLFVGKNLAPNTTYHYPGWQLASGTLVVDRSLSDGTNYSSFTPGMYQIHCGLGGYSGCGRYTHTQKILIR